MEPAVKPAVEALQDEAEPGNTKKKILIMATEHTLKGERLHQLISRFGDPSQFLLLPSPGIVRLLEAGKGDSPEMKDYLSQLLLPYRNEAVSSIVLGCTHFPFVKEQIQKALPYPVQFFDGAEGTAKETRHRLEERGLLKEEMQKGQVELFSSNEDSSLMEAFYRKNCRPFS